MLRLLSCKYCVALVCLEQDRGPHISLAARCLPTPCAVASGCHRCPHPTHPLPPPPHLKSLSMPLFLIGRFPIDFQEVKRPLRTTSGKRPIQVGKRPIKAMIPVDMSVGCLMRCFRAPPPWRKTAPLKGQLRGLRPSIRSISVFTNLQTISLLRFSGCQMVSLDGFGLFLNSSEMRSMSHSCAHGWQNLKLLESLSKAFG